MVTCNPGATGAGSVSAWCDYSSRGFTWPYTQVPSAGLWGFVQWLKAATSSGGLQAKYYQLQQIK